MAPFLEETFEVPRSVGSYSSLSGLSTVDFFPVFPRVFSPGVVMAPSHGFRLRRSGRLVATGSSELGAAQSVHSVLLLRHILVFVRCELESPLVPSLTEALLGQLPSGLAIAAGLASMDGPLLVSSDVSQLGE